MPESYIDQKTDMMHQLLWNNILREFVGVALPMLFLPIPWVGPFIAGALSTPIFRTIALTLISHYIEVPLFRLLVKWGVFTSVDWKEDGIYNAYEKEAIRLLPQLGGKPEKDWTADDEKKFADSSANLIEFHVPGWTRAG